MSSTLIEDGVATLEDLQHRLRGLEHRCWPVQGFRLDDGAAEQMTKSMQTTLNNQVRSLASVIDFDKPVRALKAIDVYELDLSLARCRQLQREIDATSTPAPGEDWKQQAQAFSRRIAQLELRLHRFNIHFSETKVQNNRLRQVLDRDHIDLEADLRLCDHLGSRLARHQGRVAKAVADNVALLDARDSRCIRLAELAQTTDSDLAQFQRQWAITDQLLLDHDEGRLKQPPAPNLQYLDQETALQIKSVADIKARALWAIATDAGCRSVAERQMEALWAFMQTVLNGTDQDDIETLIAAFETSDRKCTELLQELSRLQATRNELERENMRPPATANGSVTAPTTNELSMDAMKDVLADLERERIMIWSQMETILEKVQRLVDLFGAGFQGPTRVRDYNLEKVLDVLEQSVYSLLDAWGKHHQDPAACVVVENDEPEPGPEDSYIKIDDRMLPTTDSRTFLTEMDSSG